MNNKKNKLNNLSEYPLYICGVLSGVMGFGGCENMRM